MMLRNTAKPGRSEVGEFMLACSLMRIAPCFADLLNALTTLLGGTTIADPKKVKNSIILVQYD